MKGSTKEWLEYAARDLKAAELIRKESYLTNICLYHCQQVIEKSFKAVLEELSLQVPKIHSVTTLFERIPAETREQIPIEPDQLNTIDDIYIDSRYPTDLGLLPDGFPSIEQAKEIYNISKKIFDDVNRLLRNI